MSCGQPPIPANAILDSNRFTYGSIAGFRCMPGYNLTFLGQLRCLANKTWAGSLTFCQPVKCPEIHPAPFLSVAGNRSFGSTVNFHCAVGYTLNGSSTVTCLASARWSAVPPTCPPVTCLKLSASNHSLLSLQTFTFGSLAVASCLPGYRRSHGDGVRSCLANGTWNGTQLTCGGESSSSSSDSKNVLLWFGTVLRLGMLLSVFVRIS